MSKSNMGRKGSQGRDSRQVPRSRSWSRGHGETLLTGLLSLLSYPRQDQLPRVDTAQSELVPPTFIISQNNVFPCLPIDQSDGAVSQSGFLILRWLYPVSNGQEKLINTTKKRMITTTPLLLQREWGLEINKISIKQKNKRNCGMPKQNIAYKKLTELHISKWKILKTWLSEKDKFQETHIVFKLANNTI